MQDSRSRRLRRLDKVGAEIVRAARGFREMAAKDDLLKLLLLVDPIRAFSDSGIDLSPEARKRLRRQYPWLNADRTEAYDAIRDGTVELSLVQGISLGNLPEIHSEAEAGVTSSRQIP